MDIDKLVRKNIKDLIPYRSARDDFKKGTLLDANENALGSPIKSDLELNRYPDPYQEELRDQIAWYRRVEAKNIFLGVGSDEAIDLLIRIFCQPGEESIMITPPTYGMYKVSANINDVAIQEVQLTADFQLDVEKTLAAVSDKTKIIFLCSPNNPTGNSLKKEDLLSIVNGFQGIVVVDEAYVDFSSQASMATEVVQHPNLVVMQTLSKAFGLAGIRLGIAIADDRIINYMLKVKAPYNINKLTAKAALDAFNNLEQVEEFVKDLVAERNWLTDELLKFEAVSKVYPSDANFVLAIVDDALNVYKKLAEKGVIIRYRGNQPGCENGLRISVGTPEENAKLILTLNDIMK